MKKFLVVLILGMLLSGNAFSANKYFWWWKNSRAKTEFEERILKKIKEKIKKQKT